MSALPKQVQQQAEEADRIAQELQEANKPQVIEPTAPAEPEAPPQQPANTAAPPDQKAQPAPEPKPAPSSDEETWQKRYLTLQGMFNAEVPRLNQTIKDLQAQIDSLKTPTSSEPEKPKREQRKLVTEQDEHAFGSDLLDVVKRQAQELVESQYGDIQEVLSQLRAENDTLKKQLGQVSERQGASAHESYMQRVRTSIPDFDAVNVNPEFLAWLDEKDPMTGVAKRAYLRDAFEAFDAARTVAIFKAWPGFPKDDPAPAKKNELAKQVAPNGTKTSAAPAAGPNERVWSMQEIDKFYRDVSMGQYRGRDNVAQQIEAEIDLAVSQGRVRP